MIMKSPVWCSSFIQQKQDVIDSQNLSVMGVELNGL